MESGLILMYRSLTKPPEFSPTSFNVCSTVPLNSPGFLGSTSSVNPLLHTFRFTEICWIPLFVDDSFLFFIVGVLKIFVNRIYKFMYSVCDRKFSISFSNQELISLLLLRKKWKGCSELQAILMARITRGEEIHGWW